jgi:hypothetical protein
VRVESGAPPRTEIEQRIAEVWASVFGDARFGVDDSFFEIGGHSMLMLQVHERLAAALGRPVSIVQLFQHPTIAGLARSLTDESGAGTRLEAARARGRRHQAALGRHPRSQRS